ncbi:hypothetical protein [Bacillus sp. JJ722]|uniref:hypothetical protein n=1 Tax=Bacillus sp. JJ722 TaxID=3122973 RepID=UPI0030003FD3
MYLNNAGFTNKYATYHAYNNQNGGDSIIKSINQRMAPAGWSYVGKYNDSAAIFPYNTIYVSTNYAINNEKTGADAIRQY